MIGNIFSKCYKDLMEYNFDALCEIAFINYGVHGYETREEIANNCATIEVENYLK